MEQAFEMRQFCTLEVADPRPSDKYYPQDRDWDGGLDNEGLDISQLDNYINDANADTMYFGELSGVEEFKALGSVTPRDSPSKQPHHHHHSNPHIHQGVQHPQGHHLPDSPPDSGSEPPFSPDHPNLSPNQRGTLTELYGSQGGTTTLLNIGGFNPVHNQTPQTPHVHPPSQPHQHSLHSQTPLQSTSVPGGISYSHPQVGMSSTKPQIVPLSTVSPYAQVVCAGVQRSGEPPVACKKRKVSELGGVTTPSHGVNIKKEPEQSSANSSAMMGSHSHHLPLPHGSSTHSASGGGVAPVNGPSIHGVSSGCIGDDDEFSVDAQSNNYLDPSFQCIRFQPFQQPSWSLIYDSSLKELSLLTFRVDADKGFNFSHPDDAFVCQKKNHFQVTTHIQISGEPFYVKSPEGLLQKVDRFFVHFYGVKTESPTQSIRVEQSQSDRSKRAFHPVKIDLKPDQVTKVTVGRLHFSETTSNNMRKKGKPNPDQRYFYLVVSLQAHCAETSQPVIAHASEKIIVRASNPGQFESDVEYTFQRGSYPESIFHMGRVGINTDRPDEALVIHGNLKITGQLFQPSDLRAKENIREVDTREQLKNVQSLRMVKYAYKENFVKQAGLEGGEVYDTGVIAQEVKEVLPDAVRETGDLTLFNGEKIENFLLVNKERIFMENVGAVKELCKVTGNLENRIGELERMNNKISKLRRLDSFKSNTSSSTRASSIASTTQSGRRYRPTRRRRHLAIREEDFCNNKLLQFSTITIVCIMAFCLMAMATLYILEYRPRSFLRHSFATTSDGENYTIISKSDNSTTLFPFNFSHFSTTDIEPSMTFFPTSFKTIRPSSPIPGGRTTATEGSASLTSFVFTLTSTPPFQRPTKPPPLGDLAGCSESGRRNGAQCQVFCCSQGNFGSLASQQRNLLKPSSRSPSITVTRRYRLEGRSSSTSPFTFENDLITNEVSTSAPYRIYNHNSTQRRQVMFKAPSKKSGGSYLRFLRRGMTLGRPQNSASRKFERILTKRSVRTQIHLIDNRLPIIHIPQLNAVINYMYCLNVSNEYFTGCSNGTALNFTYAIPLSPYMAENNLTMIFNFDSADAAHRFSACSNCSDCATAPGIDEVCNAGGGAPHPQKTTGANVTDSTYQVTLIDVGMRLRASYKFRLALEPAEDENSCLFSPETLGEHFYEFNFIFYRECVK